MPMLTAVLFFFGCRADPPEAAPPPEALTPMYGKRPSLNVHVAGALVAYQGLLGRS